ncbi:hypothetical protein NQZ68_038446 [Dissostichus eleginoides]|nr:hypothetical protein NQZ68_038446 [Dissostichus eleginoides]
MSANLRQPDAIWEPDGQSGVQRRETEARKEKQTQGHVNDVTPICRNIIHFSSLKTNTVQKHFEHLYCVKLADMKINPGGVGVGRLKQERDET